MNHFQIGHELTEEQFRTDQRALTESYESIEAVKKGSNLEEPTSFAYKTDSSPLRGHSVPQYSQNASVSLLTSPACYTSGSIAICGIAFRLPGGIRNSEQFWEVLLDGKDMKSKVPSSRYNSAGFSDPSISNYGYFLEEDLSSFDASFFNMRKSELELADPQQRQLLEVTRECLENAGEVDFRGKEIGCYVGTYGEDWLQMMCKDSQRIEGNVIGGYTDMMLANRISYEFDFQGPSMVVKTGCSSSLVGLHEASRALQNGDCLAAIVAGSNMIMNPVSTAALSREEVISPDGSCKSFDASADGYGRGEAISAIFIKRFENAVKDGNPIRAVIRNTGTNADGRGQGLAAPNGKAQQALMQNVYSGCGLDPRNTAYVECHGTGTRTGDPIETIAVGNVFGENGVLIGSVKPNMGHSEGASGLTSLIKAVLALENKMIPPNIKFKTPNPKIPFKEKKLRVPVRPEPFPADRAERISVSSYGIGGSNAHAIVESLEQYQPRLAHRECDQVEQPQTSKLLVFSANSEDSLHRLIERHESYIAKHPERLADISYTLAVKRERLTFRAFSIFQKSSKISSSPFLRTHSAQPHLVMVFSGQGAQWPQMGNDLILSDPEFRKDIAAMDDILQTLAHPPEWTIAAELQKSSDDSRIHSAELSQPLCTAIQIALVNAYARHGVSSNTVVGHSSGEIAAVYAAGGLTAREAITIAYYRGYITVKNTPKGGMAAIGLCRQEVSNFLISGVAIACENSPRNVTISGEASRVNEVMAAVKEKHPDMLARELKVNIPYHSETVHMQTLASEYLRLLQSELGEEFTTKALQASVISTVSTLKVDQNSPLSLDYWVSNLVSPVLFNSAVKCLFNEFPNPLLLEIGPHATLGGPLRDIAAESGCTYSYISTLRRKASSHDSFLAACGQLYQYGVNIDFTALSSSGKTLCNLPSYPWDHTSYWSESRISREWRSRQHPHHPLLGERTAESTKLEPSWRNLLRLDEEAWLRDHKIQDDIVFPFAGFIAMAGEAVKQICEIGDGYAFHHVVVHTALVLDSRPVELFTNLRLHRLTDISISQWYEFSICSYFGDSSIEHCHGKVRPVKTKFPQPICDESSSKPSHSIFPSEWYKYTKEIGLQYESEFQRLSKIEVFPGEARASSRIAPCTPQRNELFICHPCILDSSFQLFLAATRKGHLNCLDLVVPTMIEELYIAHSRELSELEAVAWISDTEQGNSSVPKNGIDCLCDGKVVIELRGMQLSLLRREENQIRSNRHAGAYLHWAPDLDFLDFASTFTTLSITPDEYRLLEEMALLCILESATTLQPIAEGGSFRSSYWKKYYGWLQDQAISAQMGTYPLVTECAFFARLSTLERRQAIQDRFEALAQIPSKRRPATGLKHLLENMIGVFDGEIDPLDILLQDDVLKELYDMTSMNCGGYIRALSNKKPNLRILEVGAGTGGTTAKVLEAMLGKDPKGSDLNPPYAIYSFTDISAGFFEQAKERFADAPNMDYHSFDITKDPLTQGFDKGTYDIIIASNCVHATPSLQETLKNLRPLLRDDGYLLLVELSTPSKALGYLFGVFPGWWEGELDDRKDAPFVSLDRWDRELKGAGFVGVQSSAWDNEEPYQYCAAILSQPDISNIETPQGEGQTLGVLCEDPYSNIIRSLTGHFQTEGFTVLPFSLDQALTSHHRSVISTLDLEDPFFDNMTDEKWKVFQNVLRHKIFDKFLWLLPPSQIDCKNPRAAKSIGALRVVRAELAIPITTLEIDETEPTLPRVAMNVFNKIHPFTTTDNLLPDMEYAFDKGVIKSARFHPFSMEAAVKKRKPISYDDRVIKLDIQRLGLLDSLIWVDRGPKAARLKDDEVEIATRAIGMNFRDLTLASGFLRTDPGKIPFGLEISGFVRRLGPAVTSLSLGDRVLALADGIFASTVIVPSTLVAKIPDQLSFNDAATMPCCYGTVIRSLIDVGNLQKNQTILIHSAAGGVGHAAIQIAKYIGAEIFATVSSETKADYLLNTFGIPRDHIFHSRNESFFHGIMRATNNKGVDLVLNFLGGDLLHTSWKCVAPFGKMIELGKRDLAEFGKLEMQPFLDNRTYSCVDLIRIIEQAPERIACLLEMCLELYQKGAITPIHPATYFDAIDVTKAFAHLGGGSHIGKAVVRMPSDPSEITDISTASSLGFDENSTYIITGGLGGLGQVLLMWMMERGARHFILISPTAGLKNSHVELMKKMEAQGCSLEAVAGEVQNKDDVERAVAAASKPIRGVIHLAMILRDASILDMKFCDWNAVIAPKCTGAWNLHQSLEGHPLDFFVLASSIAAIIGSAGQSNYAAANTFLEAFCQYRHGLGLPASVISMSPIDDVGFVANSPTARKSINAQEISMLSHREFLDFVELAILDSWPNCENTETVQTNLPIHSSLMDYRTWYNQAHLIMGLKSDRALSDPEVRTTWRHDRRCGFYHNVNYNVASPEARGNQLTKFLDNARIDTSVLHSKKAIEFLAVEIGNKILSLLLKDVQNIRPDMHVQELGLDSLMAIELRRWWKQAFGIEISVWEITAVEKLVELGELAAKGFAGRFSTA